MASNVSPPASGGRMDTDISELELSDIASDLDPQKYTTLGIRLGIKEARLNQLKHNSPGDIVGATRAMLISWLNNESGPPATVRTTLAEALKYVERADLAERLYTADDDTNKHNCSNHANEPATCFCRECQTMGCIVCIAKCHRGHEFVPVEEERGRIEHKLKLYLNKVKVAKQNIEELQRNREATISTHKQKQAAVQAVKESIYKVFCEALDKLTKERDTLLQQVSSLDTMADRDICQQVAAQLTTCEATFADVIGNASYFNHQDKYGAAIDKTDAILQASSDRGVLSNIGSVEVAFTPNPVISLGRVEAVTRQLLHRFDLPEDKRGQMNTFLALAGRRLAVGYSNGGVDIFKIDTKEWSRIVGDVKIHSMAVMSDGNLVVCETDRKLSVITLEGVRLSTTFVTKKTSYICSVCVDSSNNVYMGYAEFNTIEMFKPTGGSPIKSVKTRLQPWFMSALHTGHIAITHCLRGINDAVQIITQDGKDVGRIPGQKGCLPHSTCDQAGNIYVALETKEGRASIRKYSVHGELLENVGDAMRVAVTVRDWLQMACISPCELAICDVETISIYEKRPILAELLKIMK